MTAPANGIGRTKAEALSWRRVVWSRLPPACGASSNLVADSFEQRHGPRSSTCQRPTHRREQRERNPPRTRLPRSDGHTGRGLLGRAHRPGGRQLPHLRPDGGHHARAGSRLGLCEEGRSAGQCAAGRDHSLALHGHRAGLRGHHRGAVARAVCGGRDPGWRRHVHQHECERGHCQSRAGAPGLREGPLRRAAPERPCERIAEHERRLPDGAARVGLLRHRGLAGRHGRLARGLPGQGRRVQGRAEDRPDAVARRRADDAGPGVPELRHHDRRRRGPSARSPSADP